MKRTIIALSTFLIITFVNGQSIDSIIVFESNNCLDIKIEGTFNSIGPYISNLNYEIIDSKINIDIFFIQCPGYAMLNPFDTIVNIGYLPSQNYLITCRTIKDINLDSTNCFPNYILTTVDSLTISYNLLDIANRKINKIEIYPNPFYDNIIVEGKNLNNGHSILITDLSGEIIKNVSNLEPIQKIELKNITQGTYFISILTPNNKQITRKLIKIK